MSKLDILPCLYIALESNTSHVQDNALNTAMSLMSSLDRLTIKSVLFPKIANVFSHTKTLGIKTTCLQCFTEMTTQLDTFTLTEKLVPLLRGIKTKEPIVMLAALKVYESIGNVAACDVLATDLLPSIWPMTVLSVLTQSQFQQIMAVIDKLSSRVHKEQLLKLKDLGPSAPSSLLQASAAVSSSSANTAPPVISFESLVIGHNRASNSFPSSEQLSAPASPFARDAWTPLQAYKQPPPNNTNTATLSNYTLAPPSPATATTTPSINWSLSSSFAPPTAPPTLTLNQEQGSASKASSSNNNSAKEGLDKYSSLL